jgi:hypothetical protein
MAYCRFCNRNHNVGFISTAHHHDFFWERQHFMTNELSVLSKGLLCCVPNSLCRKICKAIRRAILRWQADFLIFTSFSLFFRIQFAIVPLITIS